MSKVTCSVVAVVTLLSVLACALACVGIVGVIAYYDVQVDDRVQVEETIASEVVVESPATLSVRNPRGNVTVRTGPQTGRIQVEATKEARSVFGSQAERLLQRVDVQIEAEGSQARVDVDPLEESGIGFVNVDLLITVPEEIDLDVVNQAGHVRIEGTEGDIRVRSEAGNLRMQDVTVTQYCDVMNTTGNIVLEGRLPEPGASEDPWEVLLKSETGDIDFAVPADSRFTLDAESEVGSVSSKFQLEDPQAGSVRGDLGEWIKGNVNHSQASPSVILRTETGNIRITPLP